MEHLIGSASLKEDGGIIAYEPAPRSLDDLVEEALKIEQGEAPSYTARLLEALREKGVSRIVVESEDQARYASSKGFEVEVAPGHPVFLEFRENLASNAVKLGYVDSEADYYKLLHEASLELTRRKLRRAAERRDLLAAQGIRAIDDIDKTINLFAARLREWFSIHFPELDDLVREHEDYVKLVSELGHRENFTEENISRLGFSESKAKRIAEAARRSIGADLSDFDVRPVQTLASIMQELYRLRASLSEYIAAVMKEVAPNITALVGPLLGARLISLAGSLEELAKMPASTIQVLGAEKALFRALRTGGKPPKHGIIFQYPDIHRAPRWQRGKIARALASKLAIAAKVDAFTGRFIGDQLASSLKERIEEIKKVYAKPPARKPAEEAAPRPRPPKRRGRPRRGRGSRRRKTGGRR